MRSLKKGATVGYDKQGKDPKARTQDSLTMERTHPRSHEKDAEESEYQTRDYDLRCRHVCLDEAILQWNYCDLTVRSGS